MASISINGKTIERDKPEIYLIAEAGVNHGGDLSLAKKMVKDAAEAGADAIKFQTYKAEKLASKYSPAYWDRSKEPSSSQYELFKKYDKFGEDEYRELAHYCKECGIDFLSTPFDSQAADFLNELMPAFKVASADLTNHPFLKQIARYGKPIILSTGASTIGEIDEAVDVIESEGNSQLSLLHCVLSYPTKDQDAHLRMISHLKTIYPQYVIGYSDHTVPDSSLMTLNVAAVLGARIIEKHFTYDKTLEGNDHYHAMDKKDIKVFKNNMRIYKDVLGIERKMPVEAEKQAITFARRSLVACTAIPKGTKITEEMVTWKRPGTGISPKELERVLGREAKKDISEDDILTWEML